MVLTGYYMVIFRRKPPSVKRTISEWPGVSIIIAHKNDLSKIIDNLESIHAQDYPLFEVIIIDDHSMPSEKALLEEHVAHFSKVNLMASDRQGKKHALTKGVLNARFDLILCTDADCNPNSDQWIRKMVAEGKRGEVVLGYSPSKRKNGWLNLLIRFETVITAIQYMSWTLAGKPYMGVGRNMLYPRSFFLQKDPYSSQSSIPYGDDDLWVQMMASHLRFNICADPESHVISEPKPSWQDWIKQKHRHMSAGHFYTNGLWWQPGIFGMAVILHWLLIPFLIVGTFWWKWLPVMLIGLLIRWIIYAGWTKRLGDRDTVKWYLFLEINYAFYLGGMGIYTGLGKKKTWN